MGGGAPVAGAASDPELILHDAVVLTLDRDDRVASALAIAGDRIVAVGSDARILALAGPGTTVVDLDGLAVLPGFIDSHSHRIGDRELYGVSTAQEAIQMALEGGWTSIDEHFVNRDRLDELMALDAAGELRVRVNAYLPVNYEDQRFGMWFSDLTPGEQIGARLRLAGVKFFIDACGPGTQYLSEPRPNGDRGRFHWGRRELRRMVERVHDAGWQIAAHACGDGAIDEILAALERAFDGRPGKRFRARVEHLITLRDDQIARMRRLGILPSLQLTFMDSQWAEDYETMFPRDRRELLGRWRDLASDPRLRAIGSTDSPYGEGPDLAPTSAMSALVQGITRVGEPGDRVPRWMRGQRLTLMQALHLLTSAGAYGVFAEDELGRIAPDMLADIVVLSEDPRAVRPARLERVDVAMVFVGGILEVCAAGYEARCPVPLPG